VSKLASNYAQQKIDDYSNPDRNKAYTIVDNKTGFTWTGVPHSSIQNWNGDYTMKEEGATTPGNTNENNNLATAPTGYNAGAAPNTAIGATNAASPYADYREKYDAARQLVENIYQTQENKLNEYMSAQTPLYQQDRNSVYANAQQSQRQTAQNYADMGLERSGSMNTASANINAAKDNAINTVNQNETLAAQQLSNRLAELRASKAQSLSQLEGQEGADLRNYDLQMGSLTGNIGGQQTIAARTLAAQLAQQQADNAYRKQTFDYQKGYDEAGLTGTYNGQQTLAAQQAALQKALSEAALTGTYNGQQTQSAQQLAASIAQTQQAQQLAQLEALLNYNLGAGEVTGDLERFNNFTYGDAMTQLLRRLYGLS